MEKILIISNTSFSIDKFRSHYLNKFDSKYKFLVCTPQNKPTTLGKINFTSFKSKNFFYEFLKILKIFNKFKPNKVIVYSLKYQFIIAILAIFKKLNLIFLIAGRGSFYLIKNPVIGFLRKIIFLFIFKMCQKIIFINPEDKKFFIKNFNIKSKSYMIPTEGLKIIKFKNKINRKKNFIFFARIILSKGILDFIKAAKYIKKLYPATNFYVAGPLDKDKIGQTFALQSNLNNLINSNKKFVKYVGYKKSYKNIFNKMDCLIAPSYTEGAGTSVMEAMISGLYVVAYKNSGHNFILKNTKNYLCKKNNFNELLEGIEFFLEMKNNDIKKSNLISYKKIRRYYSTQIIYNKIKKIIEI